MRRTEYNARDCLEGKGMLTKPNKTVMRKLRRRRGCKEWIPSSTRLIITKINRRGLLARAIHPAVAGKKSSVLAADGMIILGGSPRQKKALRGAGTLGSYHTLIDRVAKTSLAFRLSESIVHVPPSQAPEAFQKLKPLGLKMVLSSSCLRLFWLLGAKGAPCSSKSPSFIRPSVTEAQGVQCWS